MRFPKGIRLVPTIELKVSADGSFEAGVEDSIFIGTLDRDASGTLCDVKWKRGHKPKDKWTREAVYYAASYLVGLLPRL